MRKVTVGPVRGQELVTRAKCWNQDEASVESGADSAGSALVLESGGCSLEPGADCRLGRGVVVQDWRARARASGFPGRGDRGPEAKEQSGPGRVGSGQGPCRGAGEPQGPGRAGAGGWLPCAQAGRARRLRLRRRDAGGPTWAGSGPLIRGRQGSSAGVRCSRQRMPRPRRRPLRGLHLARALPGARSRAEGRAPVHWRGAAGARSRAGVKN